MDMQTALRSLSQDLPYRLRPEQTTVLEQLGQDRHVFVSLPTGYGKSECFKLFFQSLWTCYGRMNLTLASRGLTCEVVL